MAYQDFSFLVYVLSGDCIFTIRQFLNTFIKNKFKTSAFTTVWTFNEFPVTDFEIMSTFDTMDFYRFFRFSVIQKLVFT